MNMWLHTDASGVSVFLMKAQPISVMRMPCCLLLQTTMGVAGLGEAAAAAE